jgi:hypothetical protein
VVSAHAWKFLEGARIALGTFGIFPRRKTRIVPELPEPLWLLFADEIIDLKMFRNASRIVLVGTGIILRPTEIFSDLTVVEKWFHE